MTERCQTKFTEEFYNHNFIIYIGILCTSISVLYFYRFHFTTIALSYGLGCLACYYGLNSSIFYEYMQKLKCHFVGETRDKKLEDDLKKKCSACGSKDCDRHNDGVSTEPWVGLQIHKQLDQAIEEFYNTIIDQFISSWYSKVTLQPFFVDELRHQLRHASACFLQRALKINYSEFITRRLVPCALRHFTTHVSGRLDTRQLHVAARNRRSELNYLRCVCAELMPRVLRPGEYNNPVFSVLIREIFSGWVLLPLTDVLADPHTLNTLAALATGHETMAPLPLTPDYKVEFLETFARQTESIYAQRCKLLKIDLDLVMSDQEYFYAFMQYLKPTSYIYLLQFYKDIKSFQTKLLNPELSETEKQYLYREACDIYATYLDEDSASRVPLHLDIAAELYEILHSEDCIKRLQTSRALYQAARQSHAILDKIMLPKFLHSEEFYRFIIGSRIPTGYQKQMTKKPQERLLASALKLGNKLKSALKSQAIDGQVLDLLTNDEDEGLDNVDILKYLDNLATEQSLQGEDLSTYKVVITDVETRLQAGARRGSVRVFTLAVRRGPALWAARRTEHDFHLLRGKLHEFHGDRLLHDLPLPSRRDNSPLETLRYKYEDFLQRLLQKPLLQTSELLRIFLTEDGEFSIAVQAATLNANSTDLVNIYQSVTHKLRKEKGQHLESFLKNLLVSSDMDRYQALKHNPREVEQATEVSEELPPPRAPRPAPRPHPRGTFAHSWAVDDTTVLPIDRQYQTTVVGFSQSLMYLLTKIIKARSIVSNVLGTILGHSRNIVDDTFNKYLDAVLGRLLSEKILAHLIRLGHSQIFGKRAPSPRAESALQRSLAREQLLARVPVTFAVMLGPGLNVALNAAFDMLQKPDLNKQLIYNLLDLCIAELFPELNPEHPSTQPKS